MHHTFCSLLHKISLCFLRIYEYTYVVTVKDKKCFNALLFGKEYLSFFYTTVVYKNKYSHAIMGFI